MSTIFDQYLNPEDAVISMEAACSQLRRNHDSPYITGADLSVEHFFQSVANKFVLGSVGTYTNGLENKTVANHLDHVNQVGYQTLRSLVVDTAPGFKGPMVDFLSIVQKLTPVFLSLPDQLKKLRQIVAAELNGHAQLKNMTGLREILDKEMGITIGTVLTPFFNKNTVKECQFGQLYPNASSYVKAYRMISEINDQLATVDFRTITKLSEGFNDLIVDLKAYLLRHTPDPISRTAFADLAETMSRVATAVTLSAVVQETMKEITHAANSTVNRLEKQLGA